MVLIFLPTSEAGPSSFPSPSPTHHLPLSQSTSNGTTPPTSPLPIFTRKRRRKSDVLESEDTEDGEFQPSPPPTSTSTSSLMRGGGKPPKSKNRHNPSVSTSSTTTASTQGHGHASAQATRRMTRSKARRASSPSDLITTSLEEIALEDAAVKSEIARLGLALRDVQGDGNCLFRVLSSQLFGNEKRHAEIRKLVCDYLESHKDTMEGFVVPFMKDGEGYEGYVQRMRQLKQFGSHIEIQAAARVFKRDIRVIMSTTSFTIPWRTETSSRSSPQPEDLDEDHHSTANPTTPRRQLRSKTTSLLATPAAPPPSSPSYATALADYAPPIKEGRSMLWLALFSQAEHFQSVRRRGDRDNGPAEVEDKLAVPHQKDTSEAARRERGELIDEPKTKSEKSSPSLEQLLASLPPGHGISAKHAAGVLARVKGDLGEAVEILLEDIDLETGQGSDVSSDHRVEEMLHVPDHAVPSVDLSTTPTEAEEGLVGHPDVISDYRDPTGTKSASPAGTATTSTRSRSDSVVSILTISSGCTTQSEGDRQSGVATGMRRGLRKVREKELSHGLEGMGLQRQAPVTEVARKEKRNDALRTIKASRERRRSSRVGVVGA
ncbi:hypothetical protein CI109_102176 [Kwoniella shandongensis]|uniref:Uncharacterized protein n=1 Tax=Kwoniella shandongensis TaxID=1734106 RepID=A0A5M6C0F2_9TREE|nr:uncharacterized protein CI109_003665 [Kwoniella shandongensis]KAA5528010.1 hypothetical protein CI109_003665 [Kwoniella shandongensis]